MSESILKIIFQGESENLDKKLKEVGSKLDKFNKKASALGKSLSTKLTLPLAIAGGAAIKLASDFQESLNKVDVAFGNSSNEVKDFAKTTLEQFGIAEGSALDMAALFGDMATSMGLSQKAAVGMSKQLVGLAGDLASFKNIDIEQATTALAGVFTGETESLKRLGIVMTEVNLQQFAMEKGLDKSVKTMTQAEKVALRYEFIMAKTENSQGDFARTSEGAANQMRIFQESLKELGVSFGEVLLPAFTKMITKLNDILKSLNKLSPEMKGFIVVIGGLAAAIGPLLLALPTLTKSFRILTLAMKANPIIAVASALAAVATSIYSIAKAKKEARLDKFDESLQGLSLDETLSKYRELNKKIAENNVLIYGAAKIAEKSQAKKENKLLGEQVKILQQRINALKDEAEQRRIVNEQLKKSKTLINETTKEQIKSVDAISKGTKEYHLYNIETHKFVKISENIGVKLGELGSSFEVLGNILTDTAQLPVKNMNDQFKLMDEIMKTIGTETAFMLRDSFAAMLDGESFIKTLGNAVVGLMKQLVAAALAAAVLSAILGGLGIGKGFKGFGANFGKIFGQLTNIKPMAKGGIVSTPTLGLMGEYPGARSNPEVIAPLDKLQGMIANTGGSRVEVGGQFTLKGQDLVVALQRANTNRDRLK
jgi:hypothetical protein